MNVIEVPSGIVVRVAPKLMDMTGPLLRPGKGVLGVPIMWRADAAVQTEQRIKSN
jgi:hypothetical protein